jgi:hypothetical protein
MMSYPSSVPEGEPLSRLNYRTLTGKIERNGFLNSNSKMQSDPLRFLLIRDTARAISDNDRRRRSAWGLGEEIVEGEAIPFDHPEVGDWVKPI